MRRVQIFSGNSHPSLTSAICERLGMLPAKCELTKFSNGETSVSIGTSIREQDVFIVQSGSAKTNDSVMELLIMIAACNGGSASSITAVIPYFPYSRQSKKKSHRGAITARVLANLLTVAGVKHVITVDLHAPPMRGFFSKPVDNLRAEPIIARWIRHNVPDWREAVVVSKNAGGSKRVTSLADTLKLSFGIITTDRRRSPVESNADEELEGSAEGSNGYNDRSRIPLAESDRVSHRPSSTSPTRLNGPPFTGSNLFQKHSHSRNSPRGGGSRSSPAPRSHPVGDEGIEVAETLTGELEEYKDERARDVITGRLVQGHIVDDDFPSPVISTMSGSVANLPKDSIGPAAHFEDVTDPMSASIMSTTSSAGAGTSEHPLGGTYDASDEEDAQTFKEPDSERMVTLVGNVDEKTVLIIDDIMDGPESWIAAAETVVKRGNAKMVYCIATHPLFGSEALEQMEECDCIDYIVVCNTFPIDLERAKHARKLIVLDLSSLLAEAIRRNHHGESISQLYQQYRD